MADPLFQYAPYTPGSTDLDGRVAWLEQQYSRLNGLISGWAGEGTEPYFNYLRAHNGFFDKPIMESALLFVDSSQTIPNNSVTAMNWGNAQFNTGLVSISTSVNSSRIIIPPIGRGQSHGIMLSGATNWAANSSNFRAITLQIYDASDSQIQGGVLERTGSSVTGSSEVDQTWSYTQWLSTATAYFTIGAYQNSGGNLGLQSARLGILRIW